MIRNLIVLLTMLLASSALAQATYPTTVPGTQVTGVATMCVDSTTGKASPCKSGTPVTPSPVSAAASSLVLKSSAGSLSSLSVTLGATAGYVMVFNATSAPADGAVTPVYCWQVPANGSLALAWPNPAVFSTGIIAVFSSTGCFTKTASATAFIAGQTQ